MRTTDAQVRRLMEELGKTGEVGIAAMKAGMDRKTARKYLALGQLPSALVVERTHRTREDPFTEVWPEITTKLEAASGLEAKALFEWLLEEKPGKYQPGQLRTFQRHVRQWRAMHGPDKEVFFGQEHRPGEAMQTDFTWATELGITIGGEVFEHMLCHPVLPYSNWEWATVCRSESLLALKRGIQEALFRLGRVPTFHQTDNSTAATHELRTGKRAFNDEYLKLMDYFGMKPRTIAVGESHQNGDVESLNGALKRRLEQCLLLRGSREFESVEEYERWLQEVLTKANAQRSQKVAEELAAMKPLKVSRLQEYTRETVRVSRESTIRILHNTYSVPSRLIGERLNVRVYEDRLEVFLSGTEQLKVKRLVGRHGHRINYQHVIWSLVQKPGAFPRYRYREELFPSLVFRRAYDELNEALGCGYEADMNYLRILFHAATISEAEVESALEILLEGTEVPLADRVKELVAPREPEVPELAPFETDLSEYDNLLALSVEEVIA